MATPTCSSGSGAPITAPVVSRTFGVGTVSRCCRPVVIAATLATALIAETEPMSAIEGMVAIAPRPLIALVRESARPRTVRVESGKQRTVRARQIAAPRSGAQADRRAHHNARLPDAT